jgi:hypothetical protein
MITIYLAAGKGLGIVRRRDGAWEADVQLAGKEAYCLAADPLQPNRVYCGTFGDGLWRSSDAGNNWAPVGEGINSDKVMAVAVSAAERVNGHGVVWAGTEPSMLFSSEDGGQTWQERPALQDIPSKPTWSFPPRPWTHHVRWIQPDPAIVERIFVGIELGGVMRSLDGGLTWEDRKPGSQFDSHTLRAHRLAPDRVYEAAGGGYAETLDGGKTWRGFDDGLPWHYLWGLAIDPADPTTLVVSVSPGPRQAHDPGSGHAALYRRTADGPWTEVRAGLPEPRGTNAYDLASHDAEPGVFYAAPHGGDLYRSADAGLSWEHLAVTWPSGFAPNRVNGLAVADVA